MMLLSTDSDLVARVLIVDDDREMVDLLEKSLRREGFEARSAHTGELGIERAQALPPDMVLLDVMLPGINGFEVLRRLRRLSDVPVIMLTARGEEVDRIVGLEIGADDYLPKPFSVRELVARMNAILRRVSKAKTGVERREIVCGSVTMELETRTVRCQGQVAALTTSEFDLLRELMESAGKPVAREELCRLVLGREYSVFDRSIDNLVSGLRRKLGATPDGLERIKTVRNLGYVFVDL